MNDLKAKRQYLRDENKKYSTQLVEISADSPMARMFPAKAPKRAWRSRDFLVQLFTDASGMRRLSINRTEINSDGRWKDGITWDELQRLKREAGFGHIQAIEFYPPDEHIVCDANIRHLFLLESSPLPFAWTKENAGRQFAE
jgi:hypothetical protein